MRTSENCTTKIRRNQGPWFFSEQSLTVPMVCRAGMLEYVVEHWDDGNDLILSPCHLSLLLPSPLPTSKLIKNRESESKRQHSATTNWNISVCMILEEIFRLESARRIFWEESARRNLLGGIRLEGSAGRNQLVGICWEESSWRNLLEGNCWEKYVGRNLWEGSSGRNLLCWGIYCQESDGKNLLEGIYWKESVGRNLKGLLGGIYKMKG